MRSRPRGPKRTARVAPLIRGVISEALLRRTRDPVLAKAVLTDVRVTADLRIASVYYVSVEGEDAREELAAAFERSSGFLRREVGQRANLRYTPELRFHYDESVERGRRIDAILHDIGTTAPAEDTDEGDDGGPAS